MEALRVLWSRSSYRVQTSMIAAMFFFAGFAVSNVPSIIAAQSDTAPPQGIDEDFAPFWQTYNLIQSVYIDDVDTTKLVNGAISGMVDALDDPFSGYMDPEVFPVINEGMSGKINGIGAVIRLNRETEEVEILSLIEGSPAFDSGLRPGDVFVAVEGEDITELNQSELAMKIHGPAGSAVTLTIRRGDEMLDFTIIRAEINVPNIQSKLLSNQIGYIRLNQFSPEARLEIDQAFEQLGGENLSAIVLDLRGNPGGLLDSAVDVASAFLDDGIILYEDFGNGNETIFEANGDASIPDIPLVVLVDESSASASELVAGAFQDRARATIIGETTFGKGTVQSWRSLANGGGIRLTIARWLTPDRSWIHEDGVTPDVIVSWSPEYVEDEFDPQLDAALNFLRTELGAAEEPLQ